VPGVHYATFRYDLLDFVNQAHYLLQLDANGSTTLGDMAARAAATAADTFHIYGQMDALAYAVSQVGGCGEGRKA
jgi:hypothetical protein